MHKRDHSNIRPGQAEDINGVPVAIPKHNLFATAATRKKMRSLSVVFLKKVKQSGFAAVNKQVQNPFAIVHIMISNLVSASRYGRDINF